MLVNLVGNAIKFTDQGEVAVDVRCIDRRESELKLQFTVRDTGIGIPLAKQSLIFSAFEQEDTSTTRRFGGTGLGLAITSRLAEAMGGRVWVESSPGQGSAFHFTANVRVGTEQRDVELPDLNGLAVLVVDDNETNRRIIYEMLQSWGMSVQTVAGGREALTVLQETLTSQQALPLVISDVNMPEMDGFMLAEQLRSQASLRETVVIMLTSGGRQGDIRRCEELNVAAHLMKPVKQSELLDAIILAARPPSRIEFVAPDAMPNVATHSLPTCRILLAEDGKANQMMAVGLLTKWGHDVTVADNGQDAIQLWRQRSFDLILMDVQMPLLDGMEATQRIRKLERETGRHVPIVALTARAMKGDRERCLAAGMDDYISKPIRSAELRRVIAQVVDCEYTSRKRSQQPGSTEETKVVGLDWDGALDAMDGDADLLKVVAHAILEEGPILLERLERAVGDSDADAIRQAGHALRGCVRMFGSTRTGELAERLEDIGRSGQSQGAIELLSELRRATLALLDEVKRKIEAMNE